MNLTKSLCITAAVAALTVTASIAAPVESVESGRAVALTKVQGFLSEKIVADHLASLGMTSQQVSTRLTLLTDMQLDQLASQVDTIRAGGTIETDGTRHGAIDTFFKQLGSFFYNIFQVFFFWHDTPSREAASN